jgi:hypothetical protein
MTFSALRHGPGVRSLAYAARRIAGLRVARLNFAFALGFAPLRRVVVLRGGIAPSSGKVSNAGRLRAQPLRVKEFRRIVLGMSKLHQDEKSLGAFLGWCAFAVLLVIATVAYVLLS